MEDFTEIKELIKNQIDFINLKKDKINSLSNVNINSENYKIEFNTSWNNFMENVDLFVNNYKNYQENLKTNNYISYLKECILNKLNDLIEMFINLEKINLNKDSTNYKDFKGNLNKISLNFENIFNKKIFFENLVNFSNKIDVLVSDSERNILLLENNNDNLINYIKNLNIDLNNDIEKNEFNGFIKRINFGENELNSKNNIIDNLKLSNNSQSNILIDNSTIESLKNEISSLNLIIFEKDQTISKFESQLKNLKNEFLSNIKKIKIDTNKLNKDGKLLKNNLKIKEIEEILLLYKKLHTSYLKLKKDIKIINSSNLSYNYNKTFSELNDGIVNFKNPNYNINEFKFVKELKNIVDQTYNKFYNINKKTNIQKILNLDVLIEINKQILDYLE